MAADRVAYLGRRHRLGHRRPCTVWHIWKSTSSARPGSCTGCGRGSSPGSRGSRRRRPADREPVASATLGTSVAGRGTFCCLPGKSCPVSAPRRKHVAYGCTWTARAYGKALTIWGIRWPRSPRSATALTCRSYKILRGVSGSAGRPGNIVAQGRRLAAPARRHLGRPVSRPVGALRGLDEFLPRVPAYAHAPQG